MIPIAINAIVWIAGAFGLKPKLSPFAAGAIAMTVLTVVAGSTFAWWSIHQYNRGAADKEAEWQQRALQSKLDAANADIEIAKRAATDAALRSAKIRFDAAKEKEGTDAYIKWLESRQSSAAKDPKKCGCFLDRDDLRFMQPRSNGGAQSKPATDPRRRSANGR